MRTSPPDAYYAEAVAWAVDQGITNGMGNRQFAPDQLCTIGQALTFLWRACGSPEASIAQPFSDVAETDYYAGAAAWAYENGLVTGTELGASRPCTRRAMVTYLWKLAGSPHLQERGDRGPGLESAAGESLERHSRGLFCGAPVRGRGPQRGRPVCRRPDRDAFGLPDSGIFGLPSAPPTGTHAYQQSLFDQRVAARMAQGMTRAEAGSGHGPVHSRPRHQRAPDRSGRGPGGQAAIGSWTAPRPAAPPSSG